MDDRDVPRENDAPASRIGRPPKLDEHGTPTRERLLSAAVDACVEFGYEGATLSDIARRAGVSTPAVYSHFGGKAELLVEASKHELHSVDARARGGVGGVRAVVRHWMRPEFERTRNLIGEMNRAALRQPEVAELLGTRQSRNARVLMDDVGLTASQVRVFYILLLGLSHMDELVWPDVGVDEIERELDELVVGWFAADAD
ncbi:TetR/AcrR family transcriptional regulator [Ilumatobacter sp.]|uniref:TetR/AcrR family transcriptional regulator n=1 Tax=Ilumatobacter sp. TaxID=1967498 RepID=UPI003B517B4E